jgi:tetratricopeptide (TPR) repeat protein
MNNSFLHRIPSAAALALAALALLWANAEPPRFLAPMPGKEEEKSTTDILPIPPEATEEQKEEYEKVIEKARTDDVSVTDQAALMYRGLACLVDEEYEESIPFFEEALRRDPSLQAAWEGLGWAHIRIDDKKTAKAIWDYFRRLMPEQPLPYALLGQMAVLEYDWPLADRHFKKSLELKPDQFDVRYWYAQNLMRLGKASEAEDIFRALIRLEPDRLDIEIDLAGLLVQRLEYNEAVEIYRRVNDEIPDNPRFLLEEALLELKVGEVTRADELCQQVLELEPSNLDAMRLRADIAEIIGLNDISPLRDLIDETEDPLQRAALRIRLANRCLLENRSKPGQYEQDMILGLIHDAIKDNPASVEYRILYAQLLVMDNQYAKARAVANAVLERFNRANFDAKQVLLEVDMRESRYDDALQVLSDLYSGLSADDPMAHYYRARIYTLQGRYADAKREIDFIEAAASQGAVLSLVYTALTESDWTPATSVRRLHEHILALQQEGWILVPPTEIEKLLRPPEGERRSGGMAKESIPLTAKLVDYFRWCFTGKRKYPPEDSSSAIAKPKKYFTVFFDGDLRSSLLLGNEVAEDFGVPFGIFVPTGPSKEYVPSRAGWDELRDYAQSGNWVVGSQLHYAYEKMPVDKDSLDWRPPLPNRIWLPEKNRIESMGEWDKRVRTEFRMSRNVLRHEMGADDSAVPMVAYPFNDVGQAGACNLYSVRDPIGTIVAEAARSYRLGFVQSQSGYTLYGDNLLLCRRYAPSWTDEGADVVRHAYEYHPLFIARKLRAEVAMLMNHPNEANAMADVLKRDGYPDELCRELEASIHSHFQNKPTRERPPLVVEEDYYDDNTNVVIASSVNEGTGNPLIRFDHPFVGALAMHSKANDQIETFEYGARAGIDLSRNTTLAFEFTNGRMEQTVRPRWDAVIITNVPYSKSKYKFKMETQTIKGTLTHRNESGTILSATLGIAKKSRVSTSVSLTDINLQDDLNSHVFTLDDDDSTVIGALGALWNPTDNLRLHFIYSHDYVSSAVKNIDYHGVSANMLWKPEDGWNVNSMVQYRTYSDDNAFYNGMVESMWETSQDSGIWAGLQLSTVSTSEPHDFYWTPYWDQRALGVLRYTQNREGYHLSLSLLGGLHRDEARSDRLYETEVTHEKVVVVDGVENTVKETGTEYVVMETGAAGWHKIWGFSASYEKDLTPNFTLIMEGQVMALRDYIDHMALVYLRVNF